MFEKVCIILLLNFLFFAKTICYKYSSDDIPVFRFPPKTRNKFEKLLFWLEGRSRIEPQLDHFLTMVIHAIVCVFIYTGFGASNVSFIAALLFMVNPANNQASIWISGRSYALSALGMTGALTFPYLCVFFILLCTYYNAGFLAPLAFLGSNHWYFVLVMFVAWAINGKRFFGNVKHKMDKEMFAEDKKISIEKVVLAVKTFGFYTLLAIIPFKITFYHSFLQSASGSGKEKAYTVKDRFFWLGVFFIGAIVTYWLTVPWNIASFGLLWWIICLAPFLNFFRMSQEIAERYVYLPNCGLMVVLSTLLIGHPVITAFFLGGYAMRTWVYADSYQDDYYLIESACLYSPQSWFAWHVRGMSRWEKQSYQEAVIIWTMARMLSPREFKINFNLATALKLSGHKEESEKFMKIAEDNIPGGQEIDCSALIKEWRSGKMSILL